MGINMDGLVLKWQRLSPHSVIFAGHKNAERVRLKSLEIKGFKSFADKTLVSFDENITGIVGPNGAEKATLWTAFAGLLASKKYPISDLKIWKALSLMV